MVLRINERDLKFEFGAMDFTIKSVVFRPIDFLPNTRNMDRIIDENTGFPIIIRSLDAMIPSLGVKKMEPGVAFRYNNLLQEVVFTHMTGNEVGKYAIGLEIENESHWRTFYSFDLAVRIVDGGDLPYPPFSMIVSPVGVISTMDLANRLLMYELSKNFRRRTRVDNGLLPGDRMTDIRQTRQLGIQILHSVKDLNDRLVTQDHIQLIDASESRNIMNTVRRSGREVSEECAICFESLARGDRIAITDCLHIYHHTCIQTLINCPVCRQDL